MSCWLLKTNNARLLGLYCWADHCCLSQATRLGRATDGFHPWQTAQNLLILLDSSSSMWLPNCFQPDPSKFCVCSMWYLQQQAEIFLLEVATEGYGSSWYVFNGVLDSHDQKLKEGFSCLALELSLGSLWLRRRVLSHCVLQLSCVCVCTYILSVFLNNLIKYFPMTVQMPFIFNCITFPSILKI